MELQSIAANRSVPVTHIVKARYAPGKISLPVKKSQFLYSNFKHVTGIPASARSDGYSLSKLRALDNLIERLGELGKPMKEVLKERNNDSAGLSGMINKLAGDLHEVTRRANPYINYGSQTGLVVNITA